MCSIAPDLMAQLEQTVKQFLDEGRMFTGYDVTLETRQREGIKLRHNEVRGGIHEIPALSNALEYGWDDAQGVTASWQRSQVAMPGGQWAYVYHPAHLDPNTYQPRDTGSQPVAQAAQTQAPSNDNVSDSGGQNADGSHITDCRNRLLVPTRFLRDIGLNSGDEVSVIVDPNAKIVLLAVDATPFSANGSVTKQRVERDGDMRLSSKTLRSAKLDLATKFRIENTTQSPNGSTMQVVEIGEA